MSRVVIVPLMLVLSGVPAVAVVCDLLLCPDRATQAASTGCHDHATPPSGQRMLPRADDCSHISTVDPYVTAGLRVAFQPVAGAPVASMPQAPVGPHHGMDVRPARALPNSSRRALVLPLRI